MAIPSLHNYSLLNAQMRAVSMKMGEPYDDLPPQSTLAALVGHGGMYTLLDPDLMTARMVALVPSGAEAKANAAGIANKLRDVAAHFFYKLVDKEGYTVHSELMAYISEPGDDNGVTYNTGADPSPDIPAAFTFVGQFIDHDLTFNGMNLTADERGVTVQDDSSPVIDLDSVYGPRKNAPKFKKVFDHKGRFILREFAAEGGRKGYDVPRKDDGTAIILDPRNDENQLILQIHLLVQRFHNQLIDCGALHNELHGLDVANIVDRVRKEVVANWQSFVLNEYMPKILDAATLQHVIQQIHIPATNPHHPEQQYGDLRHKPYKDLVTGKNVVRMPHEFAIGFRFGHSQLRPAYVLNATNVVLLFKDARASDHVVITGMPPITVSGKEDLKGGRPLMPGHVVDWSVFYPVTPGEKTQSLLIDHKVTARVFNLPESAIPDDVKYIGNLPHRNLIRGSQIGVVSGEELAEFYGITPINPGDVLGADAGRPAAEALFMLDPKPQTPEFKTPLWYYILKEAEATTGGAKLGKTGSRLVGEVLAGALYYGNDFPYDDNWKSVVTGTNKVTLRNIIDYAQKHC